ncbi:ABC transporter ATP-binding protein [Herbaspirillum lusitanum]|uniref:ABC transporter ATP-binding protein n=1 Tax=Herbaspirillum lusitanum TaxID=213312 RepID=UPI00030F22D6|nr:ABC transporter ATP-binding protein [Herbaspirillum lusitanum]
MSLLSIKGLHASYGASPVLRDVSLEVAQGSFTAVIGANTAGKSTMLRAISGLLSKVSGQILFDGKELLKMPAHQIPAQGIAHVPEGRHIFPGMTVEENLFLGAYSCRSQAAVLKQRFDDIYALFPRLHERRQQLAGTLSGGEQQMVALGRALMLKPRLLMLDEPSHGLAPKVVEELHHALVKIHKSGLTILLVEQNTRLALSVAERASVLQAGQIVLSGDAGSLMDDARVREAYLGI